jgi:septum formation protein
MDKAGAYAVQGAGGALVHSVRGSVSNVVGLPLHVVIELARRSGVNLLDAPT